MKKNNKLLFTILLSICMLTGFVFSNLSYSTAQAESFDDFIVNNEVANANDDLVEPQNAAAFVAGAVVGGLVYDAAKAGYNWAYKQSTPGRQALANANVPAGYKNGASLPQKENYEELFGR